MKHDGQQGGSAAASLLFPFEENYCSIFSDCHLAG